MKKILYSVMALAIAAMTFTACEDVPQPYPTPDPSTNGSNTEVEGATGDGSLENPFNSIAAISACKQLGSGGVSEQYYYIKGKVVSIATDKNDNVLNFDQGTYGNASFYISDDGTTTNQFYGYRVLYLGNKKWTKGSGDILKVGDEVIVCARLTMYNTTPETQQNEGYLYSLNGKSEGGAPEEETGTPAGDGSQANPFNVAAAIAKCKQIGESPSTEKYYVKGIAVTEGVPDASYGNATFDMADAAGGTTTFKAFQVLGTNGVKMPTSCRIPVGAEVIVYGPIYNYKNNTPETEGKGAAYIVSVNGKSTEELSGETPDTPPTPPTPTGDNLLANGDFEAWSGGQPTYWKSSTTASNATLSQSTEAHGGSYAVKVGHDANANKRMAYQEITLKAGTYTMSFYVKASSSAGASVRPGYTDVKDGKANSNYTYGDYVNDITTEWQQVTHSFTLASETTLNVLVMIPKNSGSDPIIDDFVLSTSDGGIADGGSGGGETPDTPAAEVKTVTVAEFNAASESTNVWYQLTGTISNLKEGDQYGNFDLTDATGTVYVYGVLSEKGGEKKKFQDLVAAKGIKNGSTITIIGNRGSYKDKIEVMNAYFVSVSN